jgi:hypothetical protein
MLSASLFGGIILGCLVVALLGASLVSGVLSAGMILGSLVFELLGASLVAGGTISVSLVGGMVSASLVGGTISASLQLVFLAVCSRLVLVGCSHHSPCHLCRCCAFTCFRSRSF